MVDWKQVSIEFLTNRTLKSKKNCWKKYKTEKKNRLDFKWIRGSTSNYSYAAQVAFFA